MKKNLSGIIISIILLIIWMILTYDFIVAGFAYDLDPSYTIATNFFLFGNSKINNSSIFVYGPFGFLIIPAIYNKAKILSIIFEFLCNLGILILVNKKTFFKKKALCFIYTILAIEFLSNDIRVILFSILLLFQFYYTNSRYSYIIFVNLITFLILIKSAYLILFIIIVPIFIFKLQKRNLFFLIFHPILAFLFLSLIQIIFLNYKIEDIYNLFRGYYEFSLGNSSSMTYSDTNLNWIFLIVYFLLAISIWYKTWKIPILFSFLLGNFFYFKYAMARSDHSNYLFNFSTIYFFIFLLEFKLNKKFLILLIIYFISLFSLFLFLKQTNGFIYLKPFDHINFSFTKITKKDNLQTQINQLIKLTDNSQVQFNKDSLPDELINTIKDDTVDIYPWEVGRVIGAGLNWRNRPVYQSYITYRDWLIEKNLEFYSKNNLIPKYIIFHPTNMQSIDGRYLLNDELDTFLTIKNKYKAIHFTNDNYILLSKKKENEFGRFRKTLSLSYNANVGSEISFNLEKNNLNNKDHICLAKIVIKKSKLGIIKKLINKEEPIMFTIKLEQDFRTFRLLPDISPRGILIYPFPLTNLELFNFFSNQELSQKNFPESIQLYIPNKSLYENEWNLKLECFKEE